MKGSIGIETIAVVMLLLAMFVIINLSIINNTDLVNALSEQFRLQAECKKVAGIISGIYSAGDGAKWQGEIDRNAAVYSDYIDLWDGNSGFPELKSVYCAFYADLNESDFNLASGGIIVENSSGKVVIKNA
ncbi:MAG: hypothetical protein HYW05_04530 [Candidatus Diapherotrites archaeon]|nr:hypothetical protein [Candidatus Diapherotrites archaeon]